jgi:hypothetical protein
MAELVALRAILLNVLFKLANGEKPTAEEMRLTSTLRPKIFRWCNPHWSISSPLAIAVIDIGKSRRPDQTIFDVITIRRRERSCGARAVQHEVSA